MVSSSIRCFLVTVWMYLPHQLPFVLMCKLTSVFQR